MAEEHFDIRMEKIEDHTSTDKYAIIGYFTNKQRKHNEAIARAAAEADPETAMPVSTPSRAIGSPSSTGSAQQVQTPAKVTYKKSNILADSRAEQWLLALIAFLLFLNLICKD